MAKEYLDGTERLYALAKSENVDGTIHTHPFVDGTLGRVSAINDENIDITDPNANPFLLGNASTLRSLSVLRECSAAKVALLAEADEVTEVSPLWLTTTMEAVASTDLKSNGNKNVSAMVRVSDPYGPIESGEVTVTINGNTLDSCTVEVNENGEASCAFLTSKPTAGNIVTVTYSGNTGDEIVH